MAFVMGGCWIEVLIASDSQMRSATPVPGDLLRFILPLCASVSQSVGQSNTNLERVGRSAEVSEGTEETQPQTPS